MDGLLWHKCIIGLYTRTSVTFLWLGVGTSLGQNFVKMPSVFEIYVRAVILPSPLPVCDYCLAKCQFRCLWKWVNALKIRVGI